MSIIPLTIGQPEPRTERSYRQDSTACGYGPSARERRMWIGGIPVFVKVGSKKLLFPYQILV